MLLSVRAWVLSHPEAELPELAAEGVLQRREAGEPLAYILGWREFFGRRFAVRRGVLVPRQETEILVEAALDFIRERGVAVETLDLGTGSGCIGITIQLEAKTPVTAIDISSEALEIARQNAMDLQAEIRFFKSNGFQELLGESFDLIVTNPPYIGDGEALPDDVKAWEPAQALFSGPTGLEFYERLASEAADYLRDGGRLMMEVGHTQAREVARLFESSGWHVTEIRKDLSGIERVVVVEPVFACATS